MVVGYADEGLRDDVCFLVLRGVGRAGEGLRPAWVAVTLN
jgi:hypothetical protein